MTHTPAIRSLLLLAVFAAGSLGASTATREEQLWQAAREGHTDRVRALLGQGVAVDATTEFDCTALYFAANSNHAEVMRLLIKAGADVDVRDNSYGFTAVGMAAWLGHAEAVGVLVDSGAAVEDVTGALFAATGNGHLGVVRTIVGKLELEAETLTAVLGTALRSEQPEIVAYLKTVGAKAPPPEKQEAQDSDARSTGDGEDDERSEATAEVFERPADQPTGATVAQPWPEFRGAGRSGIGDGQHPPSAWDLTSGSNVRWRSPVAGLGLSSPVVWGNRIFVTTAVSPETEQTVDAGDLGSIAVKQEHSRHEWQLQAYDLDTGALVWKRTATSGVPRSQRHWKASQANPTSATNGKVVVASFGSEGLFAFDVDGDLLWKNDFGRLDSGWFMDRAFEWGFASSPALDGDRVIVQVDVHDDSFVAALDLATGDEVWRTARDELPSWGTPLVVRDDRNAELVLAATNAIVGYDPANGNELWRVRGNSEITVASPIASDGLIIATGGYRNPRPIYAIRPGARGDVTPEKDGSNESVVWSSQSEGAYVVTPLLYRGLLYLCRDNGVLSVFDAASGERIYRERLSARYTASPVAADGRIFFTAEDGGVKVLRAGREFRIVADNQLDAATLATPAISDGMIVFRTVKGLVGIGRSSRDQVPHPDPSATR